MPTLYKHYDEAAIAAIVLIFGFHVAFISKHVYLILMLATLGTSIEILVSFGTKLWLLNFVLSIWWLWYLDQNNLFSMSIAFAACSLCFGASVVSLIHTLPMFNNRDVLIFFGGASVMFTFNIFAFTRNVGSSVCRYLWNSNQVYLMAQWEEICGLGARFSVYLKEIFLKVQRYTCDYIMTWFVRAWCFCLSYVQQFRGYLLELRDYFGRILLMSVVFAFFSINLFIFVSSRLTA